MDQVDHISDSILYYSNIKNKYGKPIIEGKITPFTFPDTLHLDSMTENAMMQLKNKIDDRFIKILDKEGISIDEWRKYGEYNFDGKIYSYKYKGHCILRLSVPETKIEPGSTKGNISITYWDRLD